MSRIAVLIPVYNEEPVIKGTIGALVVAGCNLRDIYVVNDRSTDRTAEIAVECCVNVFTVPENGGKARAQVAALEHFQLCARYDWVIFLDGDTKVDPKFLEAMTNAATNDPTVALYVGEVKSVANSHIFSASRAFDYTYGHDIAKRGQSNFNVVYVSPGCASMYRTDVLQNLHIDHSTLAEDMDLTIQVHRAGGRVQFISDAAVHTQDPATLKDYNKQVLRWSRGFWQIVKKYKVLGWGRKQAVDWYMMLLILDGLVFSRPFWLTFFLFVDPHIVPWLLLGDVCLSGLIAAWCVYRTKRWDVLYKLPAYYWFGYLQFVLWIRAFIEIIVLRKEILAWNKVARYDYSNHLAV